MNRSKSNKPAKKTKRFDGAFRYEDEDRELDPEIVSCTEMTGMIPAAYGDDDEYEFDSVEDYYPYL